MNENIYNTPTSNLSSNNTMDEMVIASRGQRFGTMIIDLCGYFAFALTVGIIMGIYMGITGNDTLLESMNDTLLGMIILSFYFILQELFFGRTLGKLIMKTKVVKIDGSKVSFKDVVIRTFCRFIPYEVFSFLGGDGRPRGWHDSISKTSVISLK